MDGLKLLVGLVVLASVTATPAVAVGAGGTPAAPATTGDTVDATHTQPDTTVGQARNDVPPETADEYLAAFNQLSGTPAFEQYTEFETIRSLAVSKLQVVEFDDTTEREMGAVLALLRSFNESYTAAQNGSVAESLAAANRTGGHVRALEEQGLTYAPLADLALSRFYENQGDALLQSASDVTRTPEKIHLLGQAATAFRQAGATQKFSQVNLRVEELRSGYERDLTAMNAAEERADGFLGSCSSCDGVSAVASGELFGTFSLYLESGGTLADVRDAERRAGENALSDRESRLAGLRTDISSARTTLALASMVLLVGYGVVVALVAMLVTHRLVVWRRTVDAANVGEIVVLQGGQDA
ncbi:hypothetical protein [Haloarchaeobius litoreus]|uniref:Uncharacterized protein n=1 Tax=Haloarchaeobius litoreus TaxID=755306 RepID=A0ABD6DJ65_9EURY|nr:hypothetical protein [Haloarchaeobius litoreus]